MHRPAVSTLSLALVLALALPASSASAQRTVEEPPKLQQVRAVERGLFLETDVGLGIFVTKIANRTYGASLLTGVFAGYDVLPFLSVALGAYVLGAPVSKDANTPTPRGDLMFVSPMLQLQLALITTERNFFYVRGDIGFALGLPAKVDNVDYGGNGVAFAGMLGFERYTKLRHFSIGIQAGVLGVTAPGTGIAISVTPTLKYTF